MRLFARLTLVAAVTAAGPLLSACDSLDSLQFWDTKKKLEGERKPVFPEGVPGITTGVPPDLYKGYREADGAPMDPAKAAAMAAAAEPEKPKVKIELGAQAAAHRRQACAQTRIQACGDVRCKDIGICGRAGRCAAGASNGACPLACRAAAGASGLAWIAGAIGIPQRACALRIGSVDA